MLLITPIDRCIRFLVLVFPDYRLWLLLLTGWLGVADRLMLFGLLRLGSSFVMLMMQLSFPNSVACFRNLWFTKDLLSLWRTSAAVVFAAGAFD